MGSLPIPESRFAALEEEPMDEAFLIMRDFALDTTPGKVSLGAGVYRNNDAKPWILPSVRKAEECILADPTVDHEYPPMSGFPPFVAHAQALVFGEETPVLAPRIASVQTISGTGACHVGARFLTDTLGAKRVWFPDPTWGNHHLIWTMAAGHVEQKLHPYYNPKTRSLDFEGMMQTLRAEGQKGDIIILHACAHNPTGLDPSKEQWQQIADVCEDKGIFPFFDSAYQGFASGDLDRDAWAIRHFASRGLELAVAQSFSKNFGLYGQRVGAFHLLLSKSEVQANTLSQIVRVIRGEISVCPLYGARVVAQILGDKQLRNEWLEDLRTMSERLKEMRQALYSELKKRGTPGTWEHIVDQIGMFSYTGLNAEQVRTLRDDHHIYMMKTGRASIAGLNTSNVESVGAAIDAVVRAAGSS